MNRSTYNLIYYTAFPASETCGVLGIAAYSASSSKFYKRTFKKNDYIIHRKWYMALHCIIKTQYDNI